METWELRPLEFLSDNLSRTDEELNEFIKKYSKEHIELKLVVYGYELIIDDEQKGVLETYTVTKVFKGSEDFQDNLKKVILLESLITFVFETTKRYSIRFSAGKGTLFPISRNFESEGYPTSLFISIRENEDRIIKEWQNKKSLLLQYIDILFDKNENELLPIMWYSKGILSNDYISAFLNYYRSVEVLSKKYLHEKNKIIEKYVENNFQLKSKNKKLQEIYFSVKIPRKYMIPLYLENNNVNKETYNKWREFRNKITHGDLSLEYDSEFMNEVPKIRKFVKGLLDDIILRLRS